jgi:hypothetical protein
MKKWVKRGIVLAVVVVLAGIIAAVLGVDHLAKQGLESGGSSALGVKTTVEKVSVGLLSSSVGLRSLRIGNPEGYKTDRLLALGKGNVACDVWSLFGSHARIHEITLDQPELTIEMRYPGLKPHSNLGDLISRLDAKKEKREETPEAEAKEKKTFQIDRIRILGTKVRFHLLAGKTADVVLPDIELTEVKNSDGTPLLLADVFRQVLTGMGVSAFRQAGDVLPADVLRGFGTTLGSGTALLQGLGTAVGKAAGKVGEGAKGLVEETAKELGKGAEGAVKGAGEVGKGVVEGAKKAAEGVGKVGKKVGEGATNVIKGTGKAFRGILGGKKKQDEETEPNAADGNE